MSNRQLAAIMFTDIVGYTAIMGNDENHALALLNKNRELQKPIIGEFSGRWIKEIGDGTMASFNTVSDAVNAAVKIQEACNAANDFQLRIGIHQGEVVFENDDVFGDAVNIAARIQAAARPGCIFISEAIHHNITNKKEIKTQFVKEEILKNVSQPVRLYQVMISGSEILVPKKPIVPVVENSIAVLPFANMSSDPEQEFFSDGISEEIINMLAQVSELKVIGRTSSFAFKGKNLDLKLIGEQLKVGYLLEGSVRKSGNTLRITAQLIKVADGFHLYSEKFDRELKDIFAIQDEVSLAILNAVKIKLFGTERDAVLKKYTDNIEAYQLYLNGRFHYNKFVPDGFMKAIEYLEAAIAKDPNYAVAYAAKAFCYMNLRDFSWMPPAKGLKEARQAAQQSLQLDSEIPDSHIAVGRIKLHWEWKIKEAVNEFKKAMAINPNSAECHVQLAYCAVLKGNYAEAIEHSKIADSLDPFSLLNVWYLAAVPWAAGDHEKVLEVGERLIDTEPNFFGGHMWVGIAYGKVEKYQEAISELELACTLNPGTFNLSNLGVTYGMMGEKLKAVEVIEKMKIIEGDPIGTSSNFGIVYASMGEFDTAFQYFEKAIEHSEGHMLWIKALTQDMPEFNKDPRTAKLLEKIGLPPY
ncbi:MAG: AraC family transcriptional regulator [Cyclobacteriaceae bacterium]|nr:AraC family transcriptional regulator [Cyclobacteriaceae bacterium]MDH5251302.1 AraC family transcriptional regulator [Cyclobacteriaceae bacterium]